MSETNKIYIDNNLCIICQKKSSVKLTSTNNGCEKIRLTANIKKDVVFERLQFLKHDDFSYHLSANCYRSYTKHHLKKITVEDFPVYIDIKDKQDDNCVAAHTEKGNYDFNVNSQSPCSEFDSGPGSEKRYIAKLIQCII